MVQFMVRNYARNGAMGKARASVTIYAGQSVLADIKIPESQGNARDRIIFTIDASTGKIFEGEKEVGPHLSAVKESRENWRTSFDNERWSKVPKTSVVYGITASKDGPIHTIEYGLHYEIQNPGSVTCSDVQWDLSANGNWGSCPEGSFVGGIFRTGSKQPPTAGKHTTSCREPKAINKT